MKSVLLLLCIGAALKTTAQNYSEARWIAKINALSWLDPLTPTLQPGIEYRLSKRTSVEFSFGIPTNSWQELKKTDSTYNRYYRVKAEVKYFPGEGRIFYLAPELSYISKERSNYNGVFVGKDNRDYGYDYAEIDKSIFALALKFGFVLPSYKNSRWLFDTYFGAGPRFIHANINAVNRQPGGHGLTFWKSDHEGSSTSIHLTFGLKIGYVLY